MSDDLEPTPRAPFVLRAWPAVAALVGLAGLVLADDFTTFVIAAMLVIGGLALELAGWADGVRIHAARLRRAALVGALAGAAIVALFELRQAPIDAADPGRVALR